MPAAQRAGIVNFAAVLFLVAGFFTFIDGLVALTEPETLFVGEDGLVISDYDAWGIFMLLLGVVEVLVGLGLLARATSAQIVAVVLAMISFMAHLLYFKHFPAWSVVIMALDVVIIYALVVHGGEFGKQFR